MIFYATGKRSFDEILFLGSLKKNKKKQISSSRKIFNFKSAVRADHFKNCGPGSRGPTDTDPTRSTAPVFNNL